MSQMKSEDFAYPPVPPELMEPTDPVEWERQVAQSEAEMDAGFSISHEAVGIWLRELATNPNSPPPSIRLKSTI